MKLVWMILLLCACGCSKPADRNKNTVRVERLGVVMEKTAPKEVVVEDIYEVKTEVHAK